MGDGNVSLLPRHSDVPAPTAMHGEQGIQLSPAMNVNIATAFSGISYQTVDWRCQLLFQVLWGCISYSYGLLLEVRGVESPSGEPKAYTIESNGEVIDGAT
nr:hypothetical protein [Tanacetum cinerariifolium]